MADTKITQLQPPQVGYPVVPATDVLPIVVIADPGMATSGSTRKVTVNQLLGAGGTATLASATITGDLTVRTNVLKVDTTNNRVGIGTATPANACQIQGAGQATVTPTVTGDQSALSLIDSGFAANNGGMLTFGSNVSNGYIGQAAIKSLLVNGTQNGTSDLAFFTRGAASDSTLAERYRIAVNGVATWSNVGGTSGTAMTLNSTGLGVGGSPTSKLGIFAGADGDVALFRGGSTRQVQIGTSATAGYLNTDNGSAGLEIRTQGVARAYFDNSGNVGIGVTPSAWTPSDRALQFAYGNSIATATSTNFSIVRNAQELAGGWTYSANGFVQLYNLESDGGYKWYTAASGTATNPVSFGSAKMTLDTLGNLILLSPSTPPTLATNGQLTVNATSNTNLRFSYRGSDGVTRVANLTLA